MARWSPVKYARTWDGAHLAFQEGGRGTPLLLLIEGFVSIEDMDDEPRLAHALERMTRFARTIRFDRRGIGLSDSWPSTMDATLERWLDDIVAVLDSADVSDVVLFGDRGGALLALGFTARHPERVKKLVLVNGYARFMASDDHPCGADAAFMETVRRRMFDPTHPDGPFDIIAHLAPSAADDVRFRAWWDRAGRRGASPETARTLRAVIESLDLRHLLSGIEVPALVMHRTGASTPSIGQGRYLVDHLGDGTLVELPGADAVWYVGDVDSIVDHVEEFITGAPPRRERGDRPTVLFTDIVDSTAVAAAVGDEPWTRILDAYEVATHREIARQDGVYVKSTGDGTLAIFEDAVRAVGAASTIRQEALRFGLQMRAGLHIGPTQQRGRDIAGITVHIAARILALAAPGQILATEDVVAALDESPFVGAELGTHELKGVPSTWRVFSVDERR